MKAKPERPGRPVDSEKDVAILDAARNLLFSGGPQAVTMEGVANRAGVSKVTVYRRYHNRLSLLDTIVRQEALALSLSLQGKPDTIAQLQEQLTGFITDLISFVCGTHHRRLMEALAALPQKKQDLDSIYRNGPERTHLELTTYLASAGDSGLIRCPVPRESAERLIGMALGLDFVRSQYKVALRRQKSRDILEHARATVSDFVWLLVNRP